MIHVWKVHGEKLTMKLGLVLDKKRFWICNFILSLCGVK